MAPAAVLLALGGDPREQPLLAALGRAPHRLRVVRRCLDLPDLLAAAESGIVGAGGVVVVSAALSRLDRAAVERLNRCGLDVLALVTASDAQARAWFAALGIDRLVSVDDGRVGQPAETAGDELVAALVAALSTRTDARDVRETVPATHGSRRGPAAGPDHEAPPGVTGRLVAVWGPVGAPGRTSVAVTLADELARQQVETLLADADTYGPSVGQVLGILDEASGLAAAARDANAGTLDLAALARSALLVRPGLRVLTGVTRPDRWPELPSQALAPVWATARRLAWWTVVDCGFCLEQDEELTYDTYAPRRNGATLAALEAADLVLAVAHADPVGLQRLVRLLPDLRRSAPQAQVRVLVNQVRRGPVGRNPERRLRESLERYAGVTSPVLVPADRDGFDAALANGQTLADAAPSSPARAALRALASELGADPSPAGS